MVDEHLPEVLPPDIKELCDDQGPVEGQLHHVVQPDVLVHLENDNIQTKSSHCSLANSYLMVRIVIPTVSNIPHPGLVQQAVDSVTQDGGVKHPPCGNC